MEELIKQKEETKKEIKKTKKERTITAFLPFLLPSASPNAAGSLMVKDYSENLMNSYNYNNIEDYSHKEGKSKVKSKKLTRK